MQQCLVVDRPGSDSETTWHLSWFSSTSLGREFPGWHPGDLPGVSSFLCSSLGVLRFLWSLQVPLGIWLIPGDLVPVCSPCRLRSRTRLFPCADVALRAEPWLVTSLELRDLAQASRCHWRQKPWDRVWEGLPGAELLCEDPWGPQPRVFPESCRVFLRVLVTGRGQGAGLRVLSLC